MSKQKTIRLLREQCDAMWFENISLDAWRQKDEKRAERAEAEVARLTDELIRLAEQNAPSREPDTKLEVS